MVDVGVDEKALSHLLEKVLVADAHAPVTLALEKAGVRTASDLVSLKLDPYVPLKYDRAVEGGNKVEKNIPLLQAEMRQILAFRSTFGITQKMSPISFSSHSTTGKN